MKYELNGGEIVMLKRALQLQSKHWLEKYRTTTEPIAREQIQQTIAANDKLAERFRRGITERE